MQLRFCLSILLSILFMAHLPTEAQNPAEYDSVLAQKLGADEYGMKTYTLVMLKTGTATDIQKEVSDSLFSGHMANIHRLAEEGLLVVAGPMYKNDQYRGIFILNVTSIDEAKKLVATDPAIQGNLLAAEYYLWYGSAALQETLGIHRRIEKKQP